ncbi:MAG: DUF1887 family protein [Chitinophagales bacterium]|nr:DUF1887 family protein [Chitinophagales bacterium]
MSRIIVNIVSDQAIQNVLFIREQKVADRYIFLSTEKMESPERKMTDNIINAAGIRKELCRIVTVVEDSLHDIDSKLSDELNINEEDKVLVNITGGTKIMSLGVYIHFSGKSNSEIFYVPIEKNEIHRVFPLMENSTQSLLFRVDLKDYLMSYGVSVPEKSFGSKNTLLKPAAQTETLFKAFIGEQKEKLLSCAEKIRKQFRGKKLRREKPAETALFHEAMIFTENGVMFENDDSITEKEIKYITGEWLEEYIYTKIKNILGLSDDAIGLGVQLIKGNAPNEYDIIFTHNNALYVIECKTDIADNDAGKISYLFTNTIYKAATLKKEFGLWVNYYLFALNDFSKLKAEQKDRAKLLGIRLAGIEIIGNDEVLKNFIKAM